MKSRYLVAALAAIAVVSSMAMAIDMGPGGRVYSTEMNWTAQSIGVASVQINPDWTVSPVIHHADVAATAFYNASQGGTPLSTNRETRWQIYGGIAPQIKESNPSGFAKLTFGAYGTGAPDSGMLGGTRVSPGEVLQIFDVQTASTGGSVSIVGQGMALNPGNVGQFNTDAAMVAWYDKTGAITGKADSYMLTHWAGWEGGQDVCWDNDGDGDYTNNQDGYLGNQYPGGKFGRVMDMRLFNNRLYTTSQEFYYGDCYGKTGIMYFTPDQVPGDDNLLPSQERFYVANGGDQSPSLRWGKIAPATINGKDTLFTLGANPSDDWATFKLYKIQDLDGDFLTTSAGEATVVFENGMTTVPGATLGYPEPIEPWGGNTFDIEIMTNAAGVNFLLVSKIDQLLVIQLDADGNFAGLGKANANDYVKVIDAQGIGHNIALDVPEPATMVLLGLGGVAALLKRRNS